MPRTAARVAAVSVAAAIATPEQVAMREVVAGFERFVIQGLGRLGVALAEGPEEDAGEAGAPDRVERKDDGTLVVGGRWEIDGAGTDEDPYEIDWRLLQSASALYAPRLGRERTPKWAEELNGKRVRINGYVLLPVGGAITDQLLLMRNEWDGCCIGVPPTPYDAIEVGLAEPLNSRQNGGLHAGYTVDGAIEGTFKFDPYVIRGWLLGLYLLDSATFEPSS